MVRRHTIALASLLVAVCTLAPAGASEACSCPAEDAKVLIQQADVVFRGTLRSRASAADAVCDGGSLHDYDRLAFDVTEHWKGSVGETLEVWSENATCDFTSGSADGGAYLVLATERGCPGLTTGLCSGSTSVAGAEALLDALGHYDAASDAFGEVLDGGTLDDATTAGCSHLGASDGLPSRASMAALLMWFALLRGRAGQAPAFRVSPGVGRSRP